jgi:catechol 2,3-dioxygenase-like lactoylglutathione lyase family enzyme
MFQPLRSTPTIAVSDVERARQFYGETLGLPLKEERADGLLYDTGAGTTVLVYPSQFAGTAQSTYMGFVVSDVPGTVKELRERGVVFEEYDLPGLRTVDGIAEIEGMRGAWFKDPDGNILAIDEEA